MLRGQIEIPDEPHQARLQSALKPTQTATSPALNEAKPLRGAVLPSLDSDSDACIGLIRHGTYASLSTGEKDGVTIRQLSGDAGELRLVCSRAPPYTVTDRSGFYNGGWYHWGTFTSPVYETATRFDTLLPSWNVTTPDETWTQLEVRARSAGIWTPWLNIGVWTSATSIVERHSVNGQKTGGWQVLTDILQSNGQVFACAYQ